MKKLLVINLLAAVFFTVIIKVSGACIVAFHYVIYNNKI